MRYSQNVTIEVLMLTVDVPGYASLLTMILFLGGIQFTRMGILGEHIGRINLETKSRLLYNHQVEIRNHQVEIRLT